MWFDSRILSIKSKKDFEYSGEKRGSIDLPPLGLFRLRRLARERFDWSFRLGGRSLGLVWNKAPAFDEKELIPSLTSSFAWI